MFLRLIFKDILIIQWKSQVFYQYSVRLVGCQHYLNISMYDVGHFTDRDGPRRPKNKRG